MKERDHFLLSTRRVRPGREVLVVPTLTETVEVVTWDGTLGFTHGVDIGSIDAGSIRRKVSSFVFPIFLLRKGVLLYRVPNVKIT